MKIGITGESGFIGRRLAQTIGAAADCVRVPFEDAFFEDEAAMRRFVGACDAVVHLAARNRPTDDPAVFETNVRLTETLIRAMENAERQAVKLPKTLFASSIREGEATAFGQSKKACRELLEAWAGKSGRRLTTMRIPNVFGAEARPFDNSFIATFSWQLLHGMEPVVTEERVVPLVHVDSLCRQIAAVIRGEREGVEADFRMPVGEVLGVLRGFWEEFQAAGRVAVPADRNLADLREVFLSYLV